MPVTILLPALSPTMEQGNLGKWLKNEGDKVSSGDVMVEVETDKATMEVESFEDGILAKILVSAGTKKVAINTPIAIILLEGEDVSSLDEFEVTVAQDVDEKSTTKTKEIVKKESKLPEINNHVDERILASPLARRIAKESEIDLSILKGSGPSGRIVKSDVMCAIKNISKSSEQSAKTRSSDKRIELSGMRSAIAERLLYSKQNIPHYYLSSDCNLDALLALRKEVNPYSSTKITINDFIIKAVALSMKKHREVNCSWCDDHIMQYGNIDVSVAVSLAGGLITPVVKNADLKNIVQISEEIKSLAERAKTGDLNKEEYQGGGFTISNLGMYDIKEFVAIINPPQAAILAIGKGDKRPVIIKDELKIVTVMTVTLSADHRVIDGALGAEFLKSFKEYIEAPISMLLA